MSCFRHVYYQQMVNVLENGKGSGNKAKWQRYIGHNPADIYLFKDKNRNTIKNVKDASS